MNNIPAVIIAAGSGSRLNTVYDQYPKTLVAIDAQNRIIDIIIKSLKQADISEIFIVTGYKGIKLKSELGRGDKYNVKIHYVKNSRWQEPNGISVLIASQVIGNRQFILTMSDHLFGPESAIKIKNYDLQHGGAAVAIDRAINQIHDIDDAMKLRTERVQNSIIIKAMDKKLLNYDRIDCGLFKGTPDLFTALERAQKKGLYSLSDGCNELIKSDKMFGCDITGDLWIDIDTPSALKFARNSWTPSVLL